MEYFFEFDKLKISKRHKESLLNAVQVLLDRIPQENLNEIVLYGSVARGTAKYKSDVDIVVLIDENWIKGNRRLVRDLYTDIQMEDCTFPEVDLHIFAGKLEEQSANSYWKNVRKDSLILWREGRIMILH